MSTPQFPPNPFTDIVPRRGGTSSKAGFDTYRRIASVEQTLGANSSVDMDCLNLYRTMGSGVLAYSSDPGTILSTADYKLTMASGTAYFQAVYLPAPATVTGVLSYTVTAGVGTWTTGKAAIYDTTGARLAISNNDTALWKTLGLNQIPMSSTIDLDRGVYYCAVLNVRSATTTAPQIAGHSGYTELQNLLTASAYPRSFAFTGQTDLLASYTLSSGILGNNARWMGLY